MAFQGCSERLLRSAWVASDPSGSRRSRSRSRAETMSRRPSGSQSTQNGNEGTRTTTSLLPSRSTAMISCAPQSANQSRPSCQRGDSPNAMPVMSICGSGTYVLLTSALVEGVDPDRTGHSYHGADLLSRRALCGGATGEEDLRSLAGEG